MRKSTALLSCLVALLAVPHTAEARKHKKKKKPPVEEPAPPPEEPPPEEETKKKLDPNDVKNFEEHNDETVAPAAIVTDLVHVSQGAVAGALIVPVKKTVFGIGIAIGAIKSIPIAISNDGSRSAIGLGVPSGGIPGTGDGIWARYGVAPKVDVGANYSLSLNPFAAAGQFAATGGYQILAGSAGGKLDVVGRLQLGYNFASSKLDPIAAGADVGFN
jgi:hypothetical protein